MIQLLEKMARWRLSSYRLRGHYIDTSVSQMHYFSGPGAGSLPPFVLLHGIASSASGYSELLVRLQRYTRRIVALDSPGHGWSSVPYEPLHPDVIYQGIQEVLDTLFDEPVVLYGNSLGGALALRYALDRPQKVCALVLSSPAGSPLTDEEFEDVRSRFRIQTRQDARHFLDRLYHQKPWFGRLLEGMIVEMIGKRPHIQGFFDYLDSHDRNELAFSPEDLAGLAPPTLFLWGESERILPASALAYYQAHLPSHARIERPPRFGHSPHLEVPDQLTQMVRDFAFDVVRASSPMTAVKRP